MASREATQEAIAQAVGLSIKTMARIYADELRRAAELIKDAVYAAQVRQAVSGKTPAAKFVMSELRRGELEEIAYRPARRAAPTAPRKGKKELQQEAAERVGGLYAPRRPPAPSLQ